MLPDLESTTEAFYLSFYLLLASYIRSIPAFFIICVPSEHYYGLLSRAISWIFPPWLLKKYRRFRPTCGSSFRLLTMSIDYVVVEFSIHPPKRIIDNSILRYSLGEIPCFGDAHVTKRINNHSFPHVIFRFGFGDVCFTPSHRSRSYMNEWRPFQNILWICVPEMYNGIVESI